MRKLNKWMKLAPVGAFVFAVGACSEQSPTAVQLEPGAAAHATAVARMMVYPSQQLLDPGEVKQLVALPRDSRGNTVRVSGAGISWSSTNPSVATVGSTGRVRAVAGGKAQIRATYGGKTSVSEITVRTPAQAAKISLTASATRLTVRGYAQLSAVAKDRGGKPVRTPLSWSSSNESVVRVFSNGLIQGLRNGSATITVTGGGASANVSITVGGKVSTPEPSRPAPSKPRPDRPGKPGPTRPAPTTDVARVMVFPFTQTLQQGLAKQFIALPRSARGSTVRASAVVWESSNPSVATVSPRGLVVARGAGTATISATVEGVTGESTVSVVR